MGLKSAYSYLMKNIINLIKLHKKNFENFSENEKKNIKKFGEHIKDINILDNIWLYGIKIGVNEIEKTENFVKLFTLEPPFTSYGKNCFATLDYIFFEGNLNTMRSFN